MRLPWLEYVEVALFKWEVVEVSMIVVVGLELRRLNYVAVAVVEVFVVDVVVGMRTEAKPFS